MSTTQDGVLGVLLLAGGADPAPPASKLTPQCSIDLRTGRRAAAAGGRGGPGGDVNMHPIPVSHFVNACFTCVVFCFTQDGVQELGVLLLAGGEDPASPAGKRLADIMAANQQVGVDVCLCAVFRSWCEQRQLVAATCSHGSG